MFIFLQRNAVGYKNHMASCSKHRMANMSFVNIFFFFSEVFFNPDFFENCVFLLAV